MAINDTIYRFGGSTNDYWAKQGKTAQTWSGSDVKVIFTIPTMTPSKNMYPSGILQTVQLQTITMSSASSLFPVRRVGEAKIQDYTKGARTFAGSMVFSIIGEDPLQRLFSVDPVRSSVYIDDTWHIDQMAPIDCILLYSNEFGATGIQVIQGIQFSNWGQTVSIDDMYLESTYSYVAEHITPFLAHNEFSSDGKNQMDIIKKIDEVMNSFKLSSLTPDDAIKRLSTEFDAETIEKYGPQMAASLSDIFAKYDANFSGVLYNGSLGDGILNTPNGSVSALYTTGPEVPDQQ